MIARKLFASLSLAAVSTVQAAPALDEAKLNSPDCKKVRADFIAQAKKIVDLEYGVQKENTKDLLKAAEDEQKRLGKGVEFNCGDDIRAVTRYEAKAFSKK